MHLEIITRSKKGILKYYIYPEEKLIFKKTKIYRTPPDKESNFNSIPLKNITSIKFVTSEKDVMKLCDGCNKKVSKSFCLDCITKMMEKREEKI